MSNLQATANHENVVRTTSGWTMLGLMLAILIVDAGLVLARALQGPLLVFFILSILCIIVLILPGFFSLQPNEARVLVLFGAYKGTVRESGLHWANPFYSNGNVSVM